MVSQAAAQLSQRSCTFAIRREDLRGLFLKCDLDGDGVIDWADFITCCCDKRSLLTEFNLQEAFASFDHYQKNMITFDDLQRLYDYPANIDEGHL